MRLRYSLIGIVLFASSTFGARADNFILTWGDSLNPQAGILTFYLPPDPIPPSEYGQGLSADATANLNGEEFLADFQFASPVNIDMAIGVLIINGEPFCHKGACDPGFFESDDALISDTSPGDPFLAGTHTGIFGSVDPATLVITPDPSTVPEPSSLLLLATGILGLGAAASQKSRSQFRS
jgi:hypothetical protein